MAPVRDAYVGRNYYALKLACWLTDQSYWEGGLTENQAMWLINRALGHKEVLDRWGDIDVIVDFNVRGTTAKAYPGRHPRLEIPPRGMAPLIILHEVAHLLKPLKREADHGPGFTAIHLMLIELTRPRLLRAMLTAYEATCTPWNMALIPEGQSGWVPLLGSEELSSARHHVEALLASGLIGDINPAIRRELLRTPEPAPRYKPLPEHITVDTNRLLACNSDKDVAKLVLDALGNDIIPKPMRRPKTIKKKA